MIKFMRVAALLGQLVLSFHGEAHEPHIEHKNDRRIRAAIVR